MLHDISRLDTHLFWIVLFYYFMWIVLFYYFMWIVLFYYYMWIVLFYYFMWIVLFYYFMWYTYIYTICFRLLPRLSWLKRDAIQWMVSSWRVLVRYNVNLKYKLKWWLQSYVAFVIFFVQNVRLEVYSLRHVPYVICYKAASNFSFEMAGI